MCSRSVPLQAKMSQQGTPMIGFQQGTDFASIFGTSPNGSRSGDFPPRKQLQMLSEHPLTPDRTLYAPCQTLDLHHMTLLTETVPKTYHSCGCLRVLCEQAHAELLNTSLFLMNVLKLSNTLL